MALSRSTASATVGPAKAVPGEGREGARKKRFRCGWKAQLLLFFGIYVRNTIIATWLIAIPIYALFPVAPPRLADIGIADTISAQSGSELLGRSTIFYNPLAAVPSLHTGFAFAIGVALAVAFRQPWAKALALLWGPVVALSVLATGNHFVFDILAGLLVTTVGFLAVRAGGWASRRRAPAEFRRPIGPSYS